MHTIFENVRKVQDYAANNDVTVYIACDENEHDTFTLIRCINEIKYFMDKSKIVDDVEDIFNFAVLPTREIEANQIAFTEIMHIVSSQSIFDKTFMI